ncbi:MAG TPA: hypothetical protein VE690_16390 [Rhodopila sp.]|nr:hypothetical protein [Rhodopila sp.]
MEWETPACGVNKRRKSVNTTDFNQTMLADSAASQGQYCALYNVCNGSTATAAVRSPLIQ